MEEILEIRDACKTPLELLKSSAFEKYLNVYKKQFIKQLKFRENTDQKEEIRHKIDFIKSILPETFIKIFEGKKPFPKEAAFFIGFFILNQSRYLSDSFSFQIVLSLHFQKNVLRLL